MTAAAPGPLAEEAVRLVEAITDWARSSVAGAAGSSSTDAGSTGTSGGDRAPECQVCPVCALLSVVRRAQPETFAHLAEASASMAAALRTLVEGHDHDHGPVAGAARPATRVERIDLDDSAYPEDEPAEPARGGTR